MTEDPSSGSLVQCLAKNYKNDSIVSVDMDKVGVMAAYCDCKSTKEWRFVLETNLQPNEKETKIKTYKALLTFTYVF